MCDTILRRRSEIKRVDVSLPFEAIGYDEGYQHTHAGRVAHWSVQARRRSDSAAGTRIVSTLSAIQGAEARIAPGRVYGFAWAAWEHGDYAIALDAAREAARMGELQACRFIARMYDAGEGMPPDPRRAARWLRFAAERGDAGCQAELGLRYEHGEGVPRDDVEACFWFTLAAANGDHPDFCPTMREHRERVAKRLDEADRERVRARVRSWRMRQHLRRTCGKLAAPFLALRRDLAA